MHAIPLSMPEPSCRVMIVSPTLRTGGIEHKIADLVAYWNESPVPEQLDIVLERGRTPVPQENIFLERVQQTRARVHIKPASPWIPFLLYLLWQVCRIQSNVILVYERSPSLHVLLIRRLLWWRKIRVVIGNDSNASRALEFFVPQKFTRHILAAQMRRWYPRADLILVPSDTSQRDLTENFNVPAEKIRVLKNWVQLPPTAVKVPAFDLIYVGRVNRVKELSRLVEIIGCVTGQYPTLRAVIVGDGREMAHLKELVQAAGLDKHIEFVGLQSDPAKFYRQAKFFCLTSRFEGMPLAGLEAMAHGLPIVTLAYPGAQELVQSGKTGWVCESHAEFCAAVLDLLENEPRRALMGMQARRFIEQEHGEDVLAEYARLIVAGTG